VRSSRHSAPRLIGTMASGLASTVYLYSCATRPPPPPPLMPIVVAVPRPVQPAATATPVSHLAKASWYGPGLIGRITTSGEPYNPKGLTAASKTLPIGSVVKVTNPQNGKSVKVRINDRGPFVPGRSLDLSQRAAEKIGIIRKGVARVKITKTAPPPTQTADTQDDN
jgi:rare lipoprotein A